MSTNFPTGTVLIPRDTPVDGESALEFMAALGGDEDTVIMIYNGNDGYLNGLPLGKTPFIANFDPTWAEDQLQNEVDLGLWKLSNSEKYRERISALAEAMLEAKNLNV